MMCLLSSRLSLAGLLLVAGITGCNSSPAQGGDVPAVRTGISEAGSAELQRAVSEALGGVPVTLSETAFTDSSLLVIERNPPRSLDQPHLGGREMSQPVRFRLSLGEGHCWLQRLPGGDRRQLAEVNCVPEEPAR
ncbi:hypothetical protein [Microbulbifer sp. YPW16]|uniref:hypothetical protein n=1 Tax=Microbulbifer sp. YPW16 TaxID=2904242 RepID=UPI001E403793|nr:hypothetical protein [Microbulbifer sp. YPW16]UHQ56583.1 hypothetical protein LVE68_06320 [Microbulbifer sp. YPW16]